MTNVNQRLAAAETARDRVAIAADHLRGALACHPDEGLAEQVVIDLVTAANSIYRQQQKGGGNGDRQ